MNQEALIPLNSGFTYMTYYRSLIGYWIIELTPKPADLYEFLMLEKLVRCRSIFSSF